MAQKNDDTTGVAIVIGGIAAVAAFIAMIVFAVAVFLSLIFTVLCVFAWNSPLQLGRNQITPEEARAFIWRGIVGAVLAPAFVGFCALLFGGTIDVGYWPYFILGGYAGGSLGVQILMVAAADEQGTPTYSPPPQIAPKPQRLLSPPASEPFRYASWNDEE